MQPFSLDIGGTLRKFDKPVVMGILNVTTDSFYAASRASTAAEITAHVRDLIAQGADIIDIGACSSRPGSDVFAISPDDEYSMLAIAIEVVRAVDEDIPISVDTFRADVAKRAVTSLTANIINDITGLDGDDRMLDVLVQTRAPYILMHMRGTPATMHTRCDYAGGDVVAGVIRELSAKLRRLEAAGIADVIVDPGFGFSKTVEQNYELLRSLPDICRLGLPVLVGISRKSMITKPLGITADEALPATTVLNAYAVARGASILRVHDPCEAHQAITLEALLS